MRSAKIPREAEEGRMKGRLAVITNCKLCPHCVIRRTPMSVYAEDYICAKTQNDKFPHGRIIAGYVEWPSQEPKDGEFPKWCPLKETTARETKETRSD